MADAQKPVPPTVHSPQFDEDLVFRAFADPVRRKLLSALAVRGFQPAFKLNTGVSRSVDATLKSLSALRSSGLVIMRENPLNGHHALYGLTPGVPVVIKDKQIEMDFGFCIFRLDVDLTHEKE